MFQKKSGKLFGFFILLAFVAAIGLTVAPYLSAQKKKGRREGMKAQYVIEWTSQS